MSASGYAEERAQAKRSQHAGYVTYILEGKKASERAISYLDELSSVLDGARQQLRFATESMPGSHENRDAPKLAGKLAVEVLKRAERLEEEGNWLSAAQMRLVGIALNHDAAWLSQ